jgi:hypothetical protein
MGIWDIASLVPFEVPWLVLEPRTEPLTDFYDEKLPIAKLISTSFYIQYISILKHFLGGMPSLRGTHLQAISLGVNPSETLSYRHADQSWFVACCSISKVQLSVILAEAQQIRQANAEDPCLFRGFSSSSAEYKNFT